jgi:hypothetical protein
MSALLSLFVVLAFSFVVMRVGAQALALTGVSEEVADFQAHSAFLGVGFTTREAEQVLAHPVRRRIVMTLMVLGNAGVVASVSSVLLLFLGPGGGGWARVAALVVGVAALWALSATPWLDRQVSRAVAWALRRWTRLDTRDYVSLLHLGRAYAVVELDVREGDWLAGRTLAELDLRSEGALVLGIERGGRGEASDGTYVGVPRGPTAVRAGDVLVAYGRSTLLDELDRRPAGAAGDRAHREAVRRHHAALGLSDPAASPGAPRPDPPPG